jgi:predicted amidohydrolase
MNDRRKFLKSMGTGICTFSIGAVNAQSMQNNDKEPYVLRDLPDQYESGYSSLKIGMCQVYTEEWKIEDNIQRTLNAIDESAAVDADIAITPECVFHGYPVDETRGKSESFRKKLYEIAEPLDSRNVTLFKDKAREKNIFILVGFVERGQEGKIHNTAALISPAGEFVYVYRKVHCRHFENINHWGYFTPGKNFYSRLLEFGDKRFNVGTMICFDREIPETLRCLRSLGAELVLCPLATNTSEMTSYKNSADNESITRIRATSNEQFIVVVNHAGRFNGGSFIVGPYGELFCQMTDEPGVMMYDIPIEIISKKLHSEPLSWMGWGYRRPEVYSKYI